MLFARKVVLTVLAAILSAYCLAQPDGQSSTDTLETRVKFALLTYYKKYPAEKLFAHLNQDVYSSGETLWYKIYAMAYGKPSPLSRVVYVQLTDTAGNVIAQNKLPMAEGKAHGDISIGPKLKSGWYKFSAFTSWMMNFDRQSYFNQKIYIHNSSTPGAFAGEKEVIEKNYHIAFFPEGGDLVSGSEVRVAFKAFGDDGLPARVEGIVKDNTGKPVANLVTVHDGMGEFTIEPTTGNSYSAEVKWPDATRQVIKLPVVKAEEISLQADQYPSSIKLQIALSGAQSGNQNFLLAAVQNSGVVSSYPIPVTRGFNEFNLPKTPFSTGILRLTLFDDQGIPVSERLLFINKHDLKTSALTADTLSFAPHAVNSFSITAKDDAGKPVQGNFSVAVTDGDAFTYAMSQNIYSALLLSPELKGETYNPGYYFKNESDTLAQELDLVMLTNGWRHFSWQKILNKENYTIRYPVEHSIYIAGSVAGSSTKNDGELNVKLMVFNHDSTKFVGYAVPDTSGTFILKNFNHQGPSDIYIQTADKKDRTKGMNVKLFNTLDDSLKRVTSEPFSEHAFPAITGYFIARTQAEARMRDTANIIMLKTVAVKAKKITPTEKLIAEHVSPGHEADREFTLDLVNYPTVNIGLINYIKGRFPGLMIVGDDTRPQFLYRGGNSLNGAPASLAQSVVQQQQSDMGQDNAFLPYFYLNDAPVEYMDVKDISLVEIALIRFMPPPVWFAPYNGGNAGALMIYTKKQSDEIKQMAGISSQYDHYIFNGYSITREFAQPDYNKLKQSGLLDDRITLYWNHDLETDANGVLKFKFNNNDITKKYRIIIQGMDSKGRLMYIQKDFQ